MCEIGYVYSVLVVIAQIGLRDGYDTRQAVFAVPTSDRLHRTSALTGSLNLAIEVQFFFQESRPDYCYRAASLAS